jgi:hypothetical protein
MHVKRLKCFAFSVLLSLLALDSVRAQQSELPRCPSGVSILKWDNCFGKWRDSIVYYVGEWQNGKWDGQGTIKYFNGDKYIGEFKDGKRNGQGTSTFANGDKYVGQWKDGKQNGQGQGTYTLDHGDRYVGELTDDKRNGRGTYTFANGDKYVGDFKDGSFNGQGTIKYFNGDKYVGEFKDSEEYGQGTLTYANGDKYVGDFKDGSFNGQGTIKYFNGDKYVGEFKDSEEYGQGTLTYANGDKYFGEVKDGNFNGLGTLYASDGSIIKQGIFENGELIRSETVSPQASARTHRVQMVKDGGTYAVPVLINDVLMLHFVVDSGASDVTIPSDVATTLMRTGTIKESDFIGTQKYQLADGSVIDSKQFIIRSLKVGDQIVENVRGSIGEVKGSLLLGQSFFEKFKSWSMDNSSHELVLE